MPTENNPAPFEREERYIVLKLNRLAKDEAEYLRDCQSKAMVECVVVESDWPEYHLVWAMIEHRMAGKPVPDFNLWRRANELQERLNVADQKIDELKAELGPTFQQIRTNNQAVADALEPGTGRCTFDVLWKSGGSAVDATITQEQYSEILSILNRNVAMLSTAFHGALAK